MPANQMETQIKAGILKALLDATKDVCTNINVRCTAGGMHMQSIDSCHIAICALVLHEAAFSKYDCAEPANLGLNFEALALTLKGCTADEEIRIAWDSDRSDGLTISRGDSREFLLKLLDLDCCEYMDIPEQTYGASLTLPSAELLRICRDIGTMGETVAISVDAQRVRFSVEGDVGKGAAIVSAGEHVTIEAPSGETAPLHSLSHEVSRGVCQSRAFVAHGGAQDGCRHSPACWIPSGRRGREGATKLLRGAQNRLESRTLA